MSKSSGRRNGPSHADGIKRVQVGCGPKNLMSDWWNVDIRAFAGVDEVMDVSVPWAWADELFFVYGEHFLEHLTVEQAFHFLRHAHRALRPGGVLRLTTPSLEWVLKTHFTFERLDDRGTRFENWNINRAFHGWGHRFLYSKQTLEWVLSSCGFDPIRFHSYGESEIEALRNLERHGGWKVQAGYPSVWIVEGARAEFDEERWTAALAEAQDMFIKYVQAGH
jgi:hypothetical protein